MKKSYSITLDEHLVEDLKKRGIALSTLLNNLLSDKIFEIKKGEEIRPEDVAKEYVDVEERHSNKTIEQIDLLLELVNSSTMERKAKEIKYKALLMLKENMKKNNDKQ